MRQLFLSHSSGRNSLLRASHHYLWKLCHSDRKTGEPRGGLLLLHEQKKHRFEQKFEIFVKHSARATLSHLSLMVVIWASHEVTRSRGLWLQPHFFDPNFNILSAPFSFNILPKTEMNSYRSFSGFSTLLEVCIISSIPSNGKKTLIVFFRFKTVWNVSKTLLLIVSCQFPFNLTLVMTFWFISSGKESGQMLC